jgi:hypothetical protein
LQDSRPDLGQGGSSVDVVPVALALVDGAGREGVEAHLGLALEDYDHVGRFRTTEVGKPVDASGILAGAGSVDGPFKNACELVNKLAASPVVEQCFARQALRFFAGRIEGTFDGCTIVRATEAHQKANGDLGELLASLMTSRAFQLRGTK